MAEPLDEPDREPLDPPGELRTLRKKPGPVWVPREFRDKVRLREEREPEVDYEPLP